MNWVHSSVRGIYFVDDLNLDGERFSLVTLLAFMGIKIFFPCTVGMPSPLDAKPVAQT